jgi:tetratricopeptide (TPR) repeat protein
LQAGLASALNNFAEILIEMRRFCEAERVCREAVALGRGWEAAPSDPRREDLARSLSTLTTTLLEQGRAAEGVETALESVELRASIGGVRARGNLARSLRNLALALDAAGDPAAARQALERASTLLREGE